ncbi:hypothetical protein ACIBCL_15230 [Micromonospora zamorensis]|uniref:hypothetical protein n=1 Tax=Micromonospora zamorensis TaxID=709883 RepID=UPI0037AD54EE
MLDEQLQPIQRLVLDVPATAKLLAATPDLMTVVLTDTRSVIIMAAGRPIAVDVAAADSATLLPGGRLLITAPRLERLEYQGREYDSKGEHLVFLVDLRWGHILDQAVLDTVDAGVIAVPHPHDGSVVLDAGMGQDGSSIYVARVLGDRVKVELVAEDVVAASFAPSGDRLLLMPHPSFDDEISVLEWPSRRTLARLHADDLAIEDFAFDLYGCFLSDQRVLVKTSEHGLLLCSGELSPLAWISLNPPSQTGDVEVETTLGVAEDVFAADVWDGKSFSATVWRIPPSAPDAA